MSADSLRTLDPELNALINKLEIPPDVLRPEAILDSSLSLNMPESLHLTEGMSFIFQIPLKLISDRYFIITNNIKTIL